jgi:hypothetical protein
LRHGGDLLMSGCDRREEFVGRQLHGVCRVLVAAAVAKA